MFKVLSLAYFPLDLHLSIISETVFQDSVRMVKVGSTAHVKIVYKCIN